MPYVVEPLQNLHVPGALALVDDAFGAGYLDAGHLAGHVGSDRGLALVATTGGRVHGLVAVSLDAPVVPADQQDALDDLLPPGVAGIDVVVVSPDARGHGLGTRLLARALGHLADAGADQVGTLAWVHGGRAPVLGPLTRLGHRQVGVLERPWHADSLARGYDCPACGRPCTCPALVLLGPAAV